MRRFSRIVAVKRSAQVVVIQDGDKQQFEVQVWKASAEKPVTVGQPFKYTPENVRAVKRIAHGVAVSLAAQFFNGEPEDAEWPFAVHRMNAEMAEKILALVASDQGAAPQADEETALLDDEAADARAAATAQRLTPRAQEAASRRRP